MFRFADKDNDGKIRCLVTFYTYFLHLISATKNLKLWSIPRSSRWRQSRVWKVDRHPHQCTSRGSPSWAARTQSPCPSPTLWTTWAWTGPQITSWSTSLLWDVIIDGASNSVSRSISPPSRNLEPRTRNITRRWARYPAITHYRDRPGPLQTKFSFDARPSTSKEKQNL